MKLIISNIAEVVIGHSFRKAIEHNKNGNISVVQAKNINTTRDLNQDFTKTYIEKTRTSAYIQSGDILLTNRGTFRAVLYQGDDNNLIAASSIFILRINDTKSVLTEYIVIYLNSKAGQRELESKNSGATIKSLSKSSLAEIEIPVPSLKNQQIIMKIHANYKKRSKISKLCARLHKEVAHAAISKLITS